MPPYAKNSRHRFEEFEQNRTAKAARVSRIALPVDVDLKAGNPGPPVRPLLDQSGPPAPCRCRKPVAIATTETVAKIKNTPDRGAAFSKKLGTKFTPRPRLFPTPSLRNNIRIQSCTMNGWLSSLNCQGRRPHRGIRTMGAISSRLEKY